MPPSTIEPRSTDQRSARYWFPHCFFDPAHLDEQEIRSVSRHRPQLNAVATHIEEISATVGIPVTIKGGIIQPAQRTIAFVITIDPSHRTNIPAHRQLTAAIKQHYPCQAAGVDETNDILWLYRLAPDQNPMQNAFAIMTARGGHDETNH